MEIPQDKDLLSVKDSKATAPSTRRSWGRVRKKVAVIAGEGHRKRETMINGANAFRNATDEEALKVLNMLRNSDFFETLPEKSKKRLLHEAEERAEGKVTALDELARKEKAEIVDEDEINIEDQKNQEKADEENRLGYLWRQRSTRLNWALLVLFHVSLIANFGICIIETFRIKVEQAKFSKMDLDGSYNCLHIIKNADSINYMVNIFHGFMCVSALYAERSNTANILWVLVLAQLVHAGNDTFQLFFNFRLPQDGRRRDIVSRILWYLLIVIIELFGAVVVIQRYYDMTGIVKKRSNRFTSTVYGGGRLLNEQIIYQNESNFLQKKYTMRQATSYQIYGIVQKIHHYRSRGLEPDLKELNVDIKAGVAALRDVQSLEGPDMMKQLRKRNAKRLKELKNELGIKTEENFSHVDIKL